MKKQYINCFYYETITALQVEGEDTEKEILKEGYIIPFIPSNICHISYTHYLDKESLDVKNDFIIEITYQTGMVKLYDDTGKAFLEDFDSWIDS